MYQFFTFNFDYYYKKTHVVIARKNALQFVQKRFHTNISIEVANGIGQPLGIFFEALCERSRDKNFYWEKTVSSGLQCDGEIRLADTLSMIRSKHTDNFLLFSLLCITH